MTNKVIAEKNKRIIDKYGTRDGKEICGFQTDFCEKNCFMDIALKHNWHDLVEHPEDLPNKNGRYLTIVESYPRLQINDYNTENVDYPTAWEYMYYPAIKAWAELKTDIDYRGVHRWQG